MNNDTYLIDSNLLEEAENICSAVKDGESRNRAVANVFASKLAVNYFENINVDIDTGLHNISTILEDIDISDIYIQNTYIDVRLYFNSDELCVPRSHFDRNILPVAYMFIKVDEQLANSSVTGFITPSSVDRTTELNGYYKVNEDSLMSYYDIEPLLTVAYGDELSSDTKLKIHSFLDGKIGDLDSFYREMLISEEARRFLLKAYKAQLVYNFISSDSSAVNEILMIDSENPATETEAGDLFSADVLTDESTDSTELDFSDNSDIEELFDNNDNKPELLAEDNSFEFNDAEDLSESIEEQEDFESLDEFMTTDTLDTFEELSDYDGNIVPFDSANFEENDINIDTDEGNLLEDIAENTVFGEEHTTDDIENSINTAEETADNNYDTISTYSTEVTPSIQSIEDSDDTEEISSYEVLEEYTEPETDTDNYQELAEYTEPEQNTDNYPVLAEEAPEHFVGGITDTADKSEQDISSSDTEDNNENALDELFTQNEEPGNTEGATEANEYTDENENIEPNVLPKKKNSLVSILGCLMLFSALGYFAYTKYSATQTLPKDTLLAGNSVVNDIDNNNNTESSDAMPIESLDNPVKDLSENEGTAVSIPAIEKNLDASILVSNLSVNWEVPSGYITNNSAKRYFTKIGKIIQLNLKTELLLLNKPPINDKIVLELEYNKNKQMFDVKGVTVESGEKSIDDLIVDTVKRVLSMNININTSSFGSIQGNPALIIKL